jgi:kynurenine formamidase
LTHPLNENIPTWAGACGFHKKICHDYPEGSRVFEYQCVGSAGTHMDAPSHFIPGAKDIEELAIEDLMAPLCVVDLLSELRPDSQITLRKFEAYEKRYGKIPERSVVVGNTGWSRYWNEPEKYRNLNEKGEIQIPSFSAEVGPLLLARNIAGIGIDTLSPDSEGGEYPIHQMNLSMNKYIIENLTNLEQLPKQGGYILAFPTKIVGGSEAPIRAIALIPLET